MPVTFVDGTDLVNFSTHNIKACDTAACNGTCTTAIQDTASPATLTGLVEGTTYFACVQSEDSAGNTSAWVASASATVDTTAPTGGTIAFDNDPHTADQTPTFTLSATGATGISYAPTQPPSATTAPASQSLDHHGGLR